MSEGGMIMQKHSLQVCYGVKDLLNNIIVSDRNV